MDICKTQIITDSDYGEKSIDKEKYLFFKKEIEFSKVYPKKCKKWLKNKSIRGKVEIVNLKGTKVSEDVVLYLHGGGFTRYSPKSYHPLTTKICYYSGLSIYVPDYPLSPKYKYEDSLAFIFETFKYIVDNHKNVIIMGDSSGGTLALSLISKITDDASLSKPYLDKIKCSILYSPWIDLGCEGKSYYTRAFSEKMATGDFVFSEMPFKNIEEFRKVALTYLGKESLLKDNIANPINIKKSQLEKFPPTMIFIGDNETLLSDIVNFGKKSQLINKNVFINLYQEMWHVWPMYSQGCTDSGHLKQSYNAFKLTSNFINGYLVDDTYKFKEIDTTDVDYMDNVTVKIY